MLRRLRGYFLAGLIVSAPIGITVWLVWHFVTFFDGLIKPMLPVLYNPDTYLPFTVPGVGLVSAILGITLIGFLAANLVGRTIITFWERLLGRMPVVRSIYKGTKQIFQTALSQSNANFKQVALIEYPRKGVFVIAFVARKLEPREIGLKHEGSLYACFMPTTPNPTSGFLFFVDEKNLDILDLTVEEGAKLVISAGLVTPREIHQQGEITADEALAAARSMTIHPAAKPVNQRKSDGSRRRAQKDKAGS